MRGITGQLTEELAGHLDNRPVAKADAYGVASFRQLVEQVARLSYLNMDHLLFFRGQDRDYRNKAGASTFYPSIYRGERVSHEQIELRFDVLTGAARDLCKALENNKITGFHDVRRRRYIQWSILQHYEVCPTPLLDFTHSLRVACSFAYQSSIKDEPYVFIFGLPYMTNRVSINSEHDLVNIRLISICPPEALRPYFQEGYLAGTDEVTVEYDSKDELDFTNRLIAKFRLAPRNQFWREGFKPLPKQVLYPSDDRVEQLCTELRQQLKTQVEAGRLGRFLQDWTDLESVLVTAARERRKKARVYSLGQALDVLIRCEVLPLNIVDQLHRLRHLRNDIVHSPKRAKPEQVIDGINTISNIRRELKQYPL